MAAAINGEGPGFVVGAVRPLFQTNSRTNLRYMYDVTTDGRFIVNTLPSESELMTLLVNWPALLRR